MFFAGFSKASLKIDESWADDQPPGVEGLVYCNLSGCVVKSRNFAVANKEILGLIDAIGRVDHVAAAQEEVEIHATKIAVPVAGTSVQWRQRCLSLGQFRTRTRRGATIE